ncbi:hypothetical protein MMC10_001248 [Thelotrema lepadinum]|nr:hypothetical protein [Thelotrema lepadinum]
MSDISISIEPFDFPSLGETASGHLYLPAQHDPPHPAVISAPAFGAVKEMLCPDFAQSLASAGIACLIFDYINFGSSTGSPRQEVAPAQQVQTFRDALTAIEQDSRINPKELGVWGTSLSGGHAMYAAATDRRVKAIVAVTPYISPTNGLAQRMRFAPAVTMELISHRYHQRKGRDHASAMIPGVGAPGSRAVMTADEALGWTNFIAFNAPNFKNEVTLSSLRNMALYNIAPHADMIRVPTLAIVARDDKICPAGSVRKALEGVKSAQVHEFLGGHFDLLGSEFPRVVDLTVDWFTMHLREWKCISKRGGW